MSDEFNMPFYDGWPLGLIATTPRSGTWYHHYLFGIYNELMLGKPPDYVIAHNFDLLQGMRLNISILHAYCPGYSPPPEIEELRRASAWNPMWAEPYIEANIHWFSPFRNERAKIAFVNRNPLDHCVSIYRHLSVHNDAAKRAFVRDKDIDAFFIEDVVPGYIYRYRSFLDMRRAFPDRIRFMPYEVIMKDRRAAFLSMLEFFGVEAVDDFVSTALTLTESERLQEHERRTGNSLSGQVGQTHIRSGRIGDWRGRIGATAIEVARGVFAEHGLSLSAIVGDGVAGPAFSEPDPDGRFEYD